MKNKENKQMILVIVILLIILGIIGIYENHYNTNTYNAIEYGDNLKNAVNNFTKSQNKFNDKIKKVVNNTNDELKKGDVDIIKVANDWESEWKDIMDKYESLQKDFKDVGNKSLEYFKELDKLANNIKNEDIKKSEIKKNLILKEKWTKNYENTSKVFDEINELLKDGNDFHNVLIASSIRQKINLNIEELKNIAFRAQDILERLNKFTEEGKKLIS